MLLELLMQRKPLEEGSEIALAGSLALSSPLKRASDTARNQTA